MTGRLRAAVHWALRAAVPERAGPAAVEQWLREQVTAETIARVLPTGPRSTRMGLLDAIADAIDEMTRARPPLGQHASILPRVRSPEQQAVLRLLGTGMRPYEIARLLGTTSNAVRQTRHRQQRKVGG